MLTNTVIIICELNKPKLFLFTAFVIAYLIYDTVEKKHEQLMRKNPKDYENDE
jgi:hypothetical protein